MTNTAFNTRVDERIDMKLGILMEHIDDKFAQLLEILQVQTSKILDAQEEHGQRLAHIESVVVFI